MSAPHASHFQSAEQQAHAGRLGMWVFLGSEWLLFAGLFALYAGYRIHAPAAFARGVADSNRTLGSVNTGILLASSTLAALSVHAGRAGQRGRAALLLTGTIALGAGFLGIKFVEYSQHFRAGIYPGGGGQFFEQHSTPGLPTFWTLYFASTGLHAIHVAVGLVLLAVTVVSLLRGKLTPEHLWPLENATLYWHLIDLIWIFLWPLYYLA
jgi:cytochrome c oxidase subunit 3